MSARPSLAGRRTRQAVILVGGRGTRLGERAAHAPKPLMQIDEDTVFLDHLLFNVARQGFDDILLLSGHMGGQIRDRYDGRAIRGAGIRVVIEPEPAGTAGALIHARDLLDETFLLANGDTLFDVNFRPLDVLSAGNEGAIGVLAMRRVLDAGRYGRIETQGARVTGFAEKDPDSVGREGLINAGVGLFRREVLDLVDHLPCSIETTVYPRLVAQGRLFGVELDGYFIDIGLPETLDRARVELPALFRRPALFLDRDGVLNRDAGYTHRPEELEWVPGAREVIRRAGDLGILTIVVSNQAGVARGFYDEAAVERFHEAMQEDLAHAGAHIDAFYFCPHHPEATVERWRHPDHPDRKPNPGMILRALSEWPIDAGASVMIGDTESDMEAAARGGIRGVRFDGGDLMRLAGPILDGMRRDAGISGEFVGEAGHAS